MNYKVENSKKHNLKIYDGITIIYIMYMMSGSTSAFYLYIGSALFVLWCLFAFVNSKMAFQKILTDKKSILLLLFLIFNIFTGSIKGGMGFTLKQFGNSILLFSPMLIFIYYYKLNNSKKIKILLDISVIIYIFWSIKAIIFYSGVQNAAREIASNRQAYGDITIGGGYGLAFGAALLSILLLDAYLSYKKPKFILTMSMVTILSIVVFQTQSTVTLMCWMVGIAVCTMYMNRKTTIQKQRVSFFKFLGIGIMLMLMTYLLFNINDIGMMIIKATSGGTDTFSIRLNSVGYALASGFEASEASYFLDRMSRALWSLKVALERPLLGVGWMYGNGALSLTEYRIGGHCEWFDALANNGFIFGMIFISIYIINFINLFKDKSVHISKAIAVTLLLLGTFNPFRTFQSQFVVFFMIPAAFYCVSKEGGNIEKMAKIEKKNISQSV